MSFHPEKFTVLRITKSKRQRRETNYFLRGQRLQVTDSAKHIGVTISNDLQWEKHTQATTAKASRTLQRQGLQHTGLWHYIEYEKVQRRAARYACNNYTERTPGCVTAIVSTLGWESLKDHRNIHCLTMLFKVKHNLVETPESESIIWANDSRTRGSQRFFILYTNVTVYKISFFLRSIQDWNKLPPITTDVQTIEDFKTALHTSVAVQSSSTA